MRFKVLILFQLQNFDYSFAYPCIIWIMEAIQIYPTFGCLCIYFYCNVNFKNTS
jgi:hypothetical protein